MTLQSSLTQSIQNMAIMCSSWASTFRSASIHWQDIIQKQEQQKSFPLCPSSLGCLSTTSLRVCDVKWGKNRFEMILKLLELEEGHLLHVAQSEEGTSSPAVRPLSFRWANDLFSEIDWLCGFWGMLFLMNHRSLVCRHSPTSPPYLSSYPSLLYLFAHSSSPTSPPFHSCPPTVFLMVFFFLLSSSPSTHFFVPSFDSLFSF